MDSTNRLTESEITFCELYINGLAPYAGNALKCYEDVFGRKGRRTRTEAIKLLSDERIQQYIEELETLNAFDNKRKKEFIARHLENIIEETSTAEYYDRKGTKLSPAALRSVCVQAMKLYSDLYPVKEAQVNKLSIDGGDGGVTFNVIVPQQNNDMDEVK